MSSRVMKTQKATNEASILLELFQLGMKDAINKWTKQTSGSLTKEVRNNASTSKKC